MLADPVIQAQLFVLNQEHHPRGEERLADGTDLVHGVGRGGRIRLHVGEAVALGLEQLAVFHDRERETWDMLTSHLGGDEVVHFVRFDAERGRRDEDECDTGCEFHRRSMLLIGSGEGLIG